MDDVSAAAPEAATEVVPPVQVPVDLQDVVGIEAEDAEESATEGEDISESKKRRDARARARERIRAERDAALAEAQRAEERRLKIVKAAEAEKPPSEADYPDPLEYVAAKAVWAAGQRMTQREVSEAQAAEQAAQQRVQQLDQEEARDLNVAWQSQVEEAATRYADFQKVVTNPELPVPPHVATMIKTSPKGPDVAYWLGTNIEAARQIARMSPVEAARVIGRIEASLTLPKPRSETQAPEPVTPVRGAARATPDPEKLSMQEYIAARRSGKIR